MTPAAGVAKLADALDSKSSGVHSSCGFESHLRHQLPSRNPDDDYISDDYVNSRVAKFEKHGNPRGSATEP